MKKLILLPLVVVLCTAPGPTPSDVRLEVVKYDALTSAVRKQRGKVVVVDFWADFCLPCKREFPKLVELDRKYRDRGLVTISVALDEFNPAVRERVRLFLERNRATFINYLLDERTGFWQDKLKIDGPPLVFVFNRRGDLAKKFVDDEVNHAAIDQLVLRLLNE
jgi:thiol-disulfide isomerase/thioredoxin